MKDFLKCLEEDLAPVHFASKNMVAGLCSATQDRFVSVTIHTQNAEMVTCPECRAEIERITTALIESIRSWKKT